MEGVSSKDTFRSIWTIEQRTFCVQRHQKHGSYKKLQEEFCEHFQCTKYPVKSVVCNWIQNFNAYGTVRNQNSASKYKTTHSGRPRKRTNALIAAVKSSVDDDPNCSVRKRAQSLGLKKDTCWRIVREDMKLFPYRIQTHQVLVATDKIKRKDMASKLIEKAKKSPMFLKRLWTSDEAHFHLHGRVNSKNNIFWGSSKPDHVATAPLHSPKVTVWAAISSKGIIGPMFFEDENGETTTVNKERYVVVLEKFKAELNRRFPDSVGRWWFQQDGAAPHTSKLALDWLQTNFGERLISRKSEFEWAPHSPDLSPPDYYLWGYLKDRVYKTKPQNLLELKQNIRAEMAAIPAATCESVMKNFLRRLELCVTQNGGHFEHRL